MKSYACRFNIYLALASVLWMAGGCASYRAKTSFAKEEQSTIRLYLEGNPADTTSTGTVLVTRERFPYTIERDPSLTEADLRQAFMVNDPGPDGGYAIQLVFDEHGSLMLDMLTTGNKGRHIIVFSQFPHPGKKAPKAKKKPRKTNDDGNAMEDIQEPIPGPPPEEEVPGQPRSAAWLAAVQIRGRMAGGIFRFSPSASREETARIVRGLKNVIAYEKSIGNDR